MRYAACFLILTLAACGGPSGEAEQAAEPPPAEVGDATPADTIDAPQAEVVISLDGEGLRFVIAELGRARPLSFGADREAVERAVGNVTDTDPSRDSNVECPAGAVEFSHYGDLTLNFQDDKFVGWSIDEASDLTTMNGIGLGSTRAELDVSGTTIEQADSSLGTEIMIGGPENGVSALMAGSGRNARVVNMWAGVNCIFR